MEIGDVLPTLVDNAVAVFVAVYAIRLMGESLRDSRIAAQERENRLIDLIARLCDDCGRTERISLLDEAQNLDLARLRHGHDS